MQPPIIKFDRAPGQDALEIKIVDDLKVVVPNDIRQMTPYVLLEQEDWFEDEIKFIRKLAHPGINMVDIGANFGLYTLAMAKASGATGKFWAVEPASNTAGFLRRSIAANDFKTIEVMQLALSNTDGDGYLEIAGSSELNALADGPGANTEKVKLTTLDKLAGDAFGDTKIDFMKIDAEGAESDILKGGADFFASQSPLIMYELKHQNAVNTQLIQQFTDMGYGSYHLIPGLDLLVPFDLSQEIDGFKLNLFACKPDCAEKLATRGLLLHSVDLTAADANDATWDHYLVSQGWLAHSDIDLTVWANGAELSDEDQILRRSLCHWAAAQNTNLKSDAKDNAAARYGHLKAAWSLINERREIKRTDMPARALILLSASRIAADLGDRVRRVDYLNQSLKGFTKGEVPLNKPFLAVDARFDNMPIGGDMSNWLLVSVVETVDKKSHFSTYFTLPRQNFEIYKQLLQNKLTDIEIIRRYVLVVQGSGGVVNEGYPDAFLPIGKATANNRNSTYWRDYLSPAAQAQL